MSQKNSSKKASRKRIIRITAIVVLVIIILLLLRFCGKAPVQPPSPVGDYEVSDTPRPAKPKPDISPTDPEEPRISFEGQLKYLVSAESPEVEMKNPDVNQVDFVFEFTDVRSGELVARTGKVPPGKYVYVNVAAFYSKPGSYIATLNIFTYDSKSGAQMNGLSQKVEIVVQ